MAKKKDEKDVLVVRDEKTGEISVVAEELQVGQQVYLTNQMGQPFPVKVIAKDEVNITFDANHEMAGKELNFKIELVEVK